MGLWVRSIAVRERKRISVNTSRDEERAQGLNPYLDHLWTCIVRRTAAQHWGQKRKRKTERQRKNETQEKADPQGHGAQQACQVEPVGQSPPHLRDSSPWTILLMLDPKEFYLASHAIGQDGHLLSKQAEWDTFRKDGRNSQPAPTFPNYSGRGLQASFIYVKDIFFPHTPHHPPLHYHSIKFKAGNKHYHTKLRMILHANTSKKVKKVKVFKYSTSYKFKTSIAVCN